MAMGYLLVITPGIRAYREYLLQSISREFRVHLVLTEPPTWELAYTAGHTVVAVELTDASGEWPPDLPTHERNILVEEFARGPEISVDRVVHHGTVPPVCLARKEVGFEPYFEETGHVVDPDDPLWSDGIVVDVIVRTHGQAGEGARRTPRWNSPTA
jgi:hypothetical protein